MPSLPSSLALSISNISSGLAINASDHSGNYTDIQSRVNTIIDCLNDGVAGEFLKGVGTTLSFDYPPGYEYGYTEFTAPVSVTATSEATANTVVTASAVTFDGATVAMIEFFAPDCLTAAANAELNFVLYDGASSIGKLSRSYTAGGVMNGPVTLSRRLTPSAAAKTYSVRAYTSSGTATVGAGAGGSGNFMPGYIRITKV